MEQPRENKSTESFRVLIVDDMATNRALVKAVLCPPEFTIEEAESGEEALELIRNREFDVVILDILMPGLDGFEVCDRIRNDLDKPLLPVIMVTSLDSPRDIRNSLEAGATDFISKPFNNEELLARTHAAADRQQLVEYLEQHYQVLTVIARLVDGRDHNSNAIDRLVYYTTVLGQEAGLGKAELKDLQTGAILHDIGMLSVPDEILLKNKALTDHEYEIIKQHTIMGYNLCKSILNLRPCLPIIRNHHERWDGSGYPDGLKGEEIPLIVRIFQIADVYHSLTCDRPFRKAKSMEEIIKFFENGTFEGQWDPNLVSSFMDVLKKEPEKLRPDRVESNFVGAELYQKVITAENTLH